MSYLRKSLLLLLVLSLSLAGLSSVGTSTKADSTLISSVQEIGFVQNLLRPQFVRDGGDSAILGDKILWTFGDTLFSPAAVDGQQLRTNSAGYAPFSTPFSVTEVLDANNAPQEFIPLSAEDTAYNLSSGDPNDRYAIWPNSVIPRPEQNDALVYFLRLKINPTGNLYTLLNTGIAVVEEGEAQATIVLPELFTSPEPLFFNIKFLHQGYIYINNCANNFETSCGVGRVRRSEALDKSKYTFWDGNSWNSDVGLRQEVMPARVSGYSPTLEKFVMFSNAPFTPNMYFRTSDNPYGPWSDAHQFYTAASNTYALKYQSHLEKPSEGKIYLTYYQSQAAQGSPSGLHVLEVSVPPNADADIPDGPGTGTPDPVDQSGDNSIVGSPKTGVVGGAVALLLGLVSASFLAYKGVERKKKRSSVGDK